jgi:hypothetical protein
MGYILPELALGGVGISLVLAGFFDFDTVEQELQLGPVQLLLAAGIIAHNKLPLLQSLVTQRQMQMVLTLRHILYA